MKYIILISCLLSIIAFSYESNVVELQSDNIFETISKGNWMLQFYSPTCGFCKHLEPIYEKLADELVDYKDIKAARFDGTEDHGVLRTFGVTGFPTLFLIKDQKMYMYPITAPREVDDFLEFIRTGYLNEDAYNIPTGLPFYEPILQFSEDIIMDVINFYEENSVAFVLLIIASFLVSSLISLIVLPFTLGYGPSLFGSKVIYVYSEPSKKNKKDTTDEKKNN